VAPRFAV
jgi:hypothetical protein